MNAHAPVEAENPRAVMGANLPPGPTPYEAHRINIEDLVLEAGNWADSSAVEGQAQADEISRLIEDLRAAMQAADASRIEENKPFDEGKAAVQAKYNLLIADTKTQKGAAVRAIEALKATLKPYLDKLDAEIKAKAAEAQKKAQEALDAAQAAAKAAQVDNLQSADTAHDLAEKARQAQKAATYAQNDKAQARGGSRALGLKTYYEAEITDQKAALIHYATTQREALMGFVLTLAQTDATAGKRQIPGVAVHERTRL